MDMGAYLKEGGIFLGLKFRIIQEMSYFCSPNFGQLCLQLYE